MDYKTIIEQLAEKNKKGYESLYILFANKFYGYAITKWNFSEDESWDIVYKTLETLVNKLSNYKFESQAHFNGFVFKVFINFLRQQYRLNKTREKEINFIRLGEVDYGEVDSALEGIETNKIEGSFSKEFFTDYYHNEGGENPKLIELKKALEKLDKNEQDILLLKAQNYTYDEIAQMLRIENKQLKVKHHRAKHKLLVLLQELLTTSI